MPRSQLPSRGQLKFRWEFCSSPVCLLVRQHVSLFFSSAAYGFLNGVPRGFGNCWFRCWHALGSPSEEPVGDGALTRGLRSGGHLLRGGDRARFSCEFPL